MKRATCFSVSPEGAKAVGGLHHYVTTGTALPARLIHLVFSASPRAMGAPTASTSTRALSSS